MRSAFAILYRDTIYLKTGGVQPGIMAGFGIPSDAHRKRTSRPKGAQNTPNLPLSRRICIRRINRRGSSLGPSIYDVLPGMHISRSSITQGSAAVQPGLKSGTPLV